MNKIIQNKYVSIVWTFLRVWLGWKWLNFGWDKIRGKVPIRDFISIHLEGAIAKANPELGSTTVSKWYASFIEHVALPQSDTFATFVMLGEFLVGIALILGVATTFALFIAAFMNFNFLFSGSLGGGGISPIMAAATMILVAVGPATSLYALDRWLRPICAKKIKKWKDKKSITV